MKYFILLFLTIMTVLISSCGFHLRGTHGDNYKFPFKSVYIQCDNVIICKKFIKSIQTEQLAIIVNDPTKADVTIRLFNEQTQRNVAGISSIGRVSSYQLTYMVNIAVLDHGDLVGNEMNITSNILMQYNDANILSDQQEEETFWDQAHTNAVRQIIRRITHLKYRKYSLNVNESQ